MPPDIARDVWAARHHAELPLARVLQRRVRHPAGDPLALQLGRYFGMDKSYHAVALSIGDLRQAVADHKLEALCRAVVANLRRLGYRHCLLLPFKDALAMRPIAKRLVPRAATAAECSLLTTNDMLAIGARQLEPPVQRQRLARKRRDRERARLRRRVRRCVAGYTASIGEALPPVRVVTERFVGGHPAAAERDARVFQQR